MILSFAWTTPAVLLHEKDTTRRDWKEKTIRQFEQLAYLNRLGLDGSAHAYDKAPRFGGKRFGTVRITEVIRSEDSRTIEAEEWRREGFHVLQAMGAKIGKSSPADVWRFWKAENDEPQTVIRFQLVDFNEYGEHLREIAEVDRALSAWSVDLEEALSAN